MWMKEKLRYYGVLYTVRILFSKMKIKNIRIYDFITASGYHKFNFIIKDQIFAFIL